MNKHSLRGVLAVAGLACMSPAAHADLYSAVKAVDSKDFAKAFVLYRELAELGLREAQESLAIAYVNGEGVPRDNVLGYAWATLAQEQASSPASKGIIDQLEPHVTQAARQKVAEVEAQFGQGAIQKRWLPDPLPDKVEPPAKSCAFKSPANPQNFYPTYALSQDISADVFVDFVISPDGRAHNPHVWYAIPADLFDEAARRVILNSQFFPKIENGVEVSCSLRVMIKFGFWSGGKAGGAADPTSAMTTRKAEAEAGDPMAQLLYGLILATRRDLNLDNEKYLSWFVKAAQAGIPLAQFWTGTYIFNGNGAARDEAKGLRWIEKAADAGSANAQVTLANYLMRPGGDPAKIGTAMGYLERAAASGNREGKLHLAALLAADTDPSHRDPQRALTLLASLMPGVESLPTAFEIRAAAEAMLGDFVLAQNDQKKALKMASKLGWDRRPQQERLAAYVGGKTWTGQLITP